MTKEDFESACAALPEGVSWGDPLTPEIAREIGMAWLAAQTPVAWINTADRLFVFARTDKDCCPADPAFQPVAIVAAANKANGDA